MQHKFKNFVIDKVLIPGDTESFIFEIEQHLRRLMKKRKHMMKYTFILSLIILWKGCYRLCTIIKMM